MTMMLNTVTTFASAQTAQSAPASRAAGKVAAAAPAAPAAGQAAPAAGQAAAPAAAQPFAQWMGRQAAGAQAASQAAAPSAAPSDDSVLDAVAGQVDGAPAKAANSTANPTAQDTTADAGDDGQSAAVQPDGALLAAMAMPLMPLSPARVAQAVQAAQGKGPQSGARTDDAAARTMAATGQDDARRAALAQPALAAQAPLQPLQPQQQPQQPQQPVAPGQASRPAQQPAQHEGEAAAVRLAVQAAGTNTTGKDGSTEGGSTPGGGNALGAAAQLGTAMSALPSAAQPAGDTVTLAGPPTAWRQSLQEALGERLQLQVGNNVEQAVIRLEPPQLGQIDIAIRHSAGSLEVSISATNGEVLRQLQGVSDNLRSDLSQRQFSDVAVTVAPAPRNQAAPFGDPQQQGRGRQQGREQDEYEPGRGLAEAGNPASAFSLG